MTGGGGRGEGNLLTDVVSVFKNQIDCGENFAQNFYMLSPSSLGSPLNTHPPPGLTCPCLSSPDLSCLQTVPAGQLTGVILVFTAVTVQ